MPLLKLLHAGTLDTVVCIIFYDVSNIICFILFLDGFFNLRVPVRTVEQCLAQCEVRADHDRSAPR